MGTGPIQNWWPGASYVTWIGIDGFYSKPSDTFASVFGKTISQARALTTKPKPVLLAETAVGPQANQFANIIQPVRGRPEGQRPRPGLVRHCAARRSDPQDWRIESSPTAEPAFQLGVQDLFGSSG